MPSANIPDVPTVTVVLALIASSLTDVAVMTTAPAAAGAVNDVAALLAVWPGLNEPQLEAGVQLQVTPALAGSLATVAEIPAVALAANDHCAGLLRVISIPDAALIAMGGALAETEVFVAEIAVMVTEPVVLGALYVTVAPLALWFELKVPQDPAGAHFHITPPFAESLATVALMGAVSLTNSVPGVAPTVTVMG